MSNSSAAQEPSMEEILASIRRIISDEEAAIGEEPSPEEAKPATEEPMSQEDLDAMFDEPAPAPEVDDTEDDMAAAMLAAEEEEQQEDVLELPSEWQETDLVEPQDDDLVFASEPEPEPEETPQADFEQVVKETVEQQIPDILKSSFASMPTPDGPLPGVERGAPLVSDTTSKMVNSAFGDLTHTVLSNNSRTIDSVVEDMLRPMLKAWLDQNLPIMVERLVRAEIERVSRGEQHYR